MFILVKLLSALLLPPGIIIVLLSGMTVYLFRKKDRLRYVLLSITVGLYLLSIPLTSTLLLQPLENKYQPELTGADAIVVLGGGALLRTDPLHANGMLGAYSANRLLTVLQLHSREQLPVVITGGAPLPNSGNEAQISHEILQSLQVAESSLIIEDKARNTHENAVNVLQLCEKYKWRKIYLVTSAFHMPRSMAEFNRVKGAYALTLQPYPCDYQTGSEHQVSLFSFVPSQQSFSESALALHEYLGLFALSLRI